MCELAEFLQLYLVGTILLPSCDQTGTDMLSNVLGATRPACGEPGSESGPPGSSLQFAAALLYRDYKVRTEKSRVNEGFRVQ